MMAPVVSATLATVAVVGQWRGTDLAAQVSARRPFRRYGFALWNGQWFGGHATLGYSVVAPMVSAIAGR